MDIRLDGTFWSSALSNALGTLIAASVTALFIYLVFNPVKRWFYIQNPKLAQFIQSVIFLITKPYSRLGYFAFFLIYLYFGFPYKEAALVGVIVIFLSFFNTKNNIYKLSSLSTSFSDDFVSSDNQLRGSKWVIKTGSPEIFLEMGRPRLELTTSYPPQGTNCFLLVRDKDIQRGVIECDIYLSPDSLFNIVFFCDDNNDKWHMARYEGRSTESDAFLIKDEGPGANWRFNKILGTKTNPNQWHRIRVEFNSERARMFRNGDLLGEITNPPVLGKRVGFFNECNEVLVGNFSISET